MKPNNKQMEKILEFYNSGKERIGGMAWQANQIFSSKSKKIMEEYEKIRAELAAKKFESVSEDSKYPGVSVRKQPDGQIIVTAMDPTIEQMSRLVERDDFVDLMKKSGIFDSVKEVIEAELDEEDLNKNETVVFEMSTDEDVIPTTDEIVFEDTEIWNGSFESESNREEDAVEEADEHLHLEADESAEMCKSDLAVKLTHFKEEAERKLAEAKKRMEEKRDVDFETEIKKMLDSGYDWTEIANKFADTMASVHDEVSDEHLMEVKVESLKEALKDYYGGEMDEIIDHWSVEEVRHTLDYFKEIYNTLEHLTFPLLKK